MAIHRFDELDSTQDRAHELAAGGAAHGTVVVAAVQTRGRGTRGREWSAGRGGLWLTVILRPAAAPLASEKIASERKVHSSDVMKYAVFLFALGCVYGIDVLLFGATAEYVASLLTNNWMLVLIAKYGIPLFFLGIEVLISLKIIEARDAREQEEVPSYGW